MTRKRAVLIKQLPSPDCIVIEVIAYRDKIPHLTQGQLDEIYDYINRRRPGAETHLHFLPKITDIGYPKGAISLTVHGPRVAEIIADFHRQWADKIYASDNVSCKLNPLGGGDAGNLP